MLSFADKIMLRFTIYQNSKYGIIELAHMGRKSYFQNTTKM